MSVSSLSQDLQLVLASLLFLDLLLSASSLVSRCTGVSTALCLLTHSHSVSFQSPCSIIWGLYCSLPTHSLSFCQLPVLSLDALESLLLFAYSLTLILSASILPARSSGVSTALCLLTLILSASSLPARCTGVSTALCLLTHSHSVSFQSPCSMHWSLYCSLPTHLLSFCQLPVSLLDALESLLLFAYSLTLILSASSLPARSSGVSNVLRLLDLNN